MQLYLYLLLISTLLNVGLALKILNLRGQLLTTKGRDLTPEEMESLKKRLIRIKKITEASNNFIP
ncbi:MAG: hypothetical protein V3T58_00680 [Candidatus Hydrothermarchaeales archaeon]